MRWAFRGGWAFVGWTFSFGVHYATRHNWNGVLSFFGIAVAIGLVLHVYDPQPPAGTGKNAVNATQPRRKS